ncbi:hypothetical protein RYH80_17470 [Halobaculum sp. MBLA0147]|uniref:hypothetical protein n=1 Tax=Halobaculum sp. MBLA0147 TaxID=3079934 RepID=UPI003524BFAF
MGLLAASTGCSLHRGGGPGDAIGSSAPGRRDWETRSGVPRPGDGTGRRDREVRVPRSSRATGPFENYPSVANVFCAGGLTGELVQSTGFATRDDAVSSTAEVELLRDTAYV